MREIIFKNLPSFRQELTLDGTPYIIDFDYNSRGQYWSLNWYDRDQNPIRMGLKLVTGTELLEQYVDVGLPPGRLVIIADDGNLNRIEQNDFIEGKKRLMYVEEAELASV
jgi:hypothetical protein